MIEPNDWTYLLLGALIAAATQAAKIGGGALVPPMRVILSSCLIASVAAFSLGGCLLIWMNVSAQASCFLSGVVGFVGGDWVLASMAKQAGERVGEEELYKSLMLRMRDDKPD